MRLRPLLTLADAELIVAACRVEAARRGHVRIATADDAGHPPASTRVDGANPIIATAATEDARTAALTPVAGRGA